MDELHQALYSPNPRYKKNGNNSEKFLPLDGNEEASGILHRQMPKTLEMQCRAPTSNMTIASPSYSKTEVENAFNGFHPIKSTHKASILA